jgi:hypothetical protein
MTPLFIVLASVAILAVVIGFVGAQLAGAHTQAARMIREFQERNEDV